MSIIRLIILSFVYSAIGMFATYGQQVNESPYAIFGDNTPTLDVNYNRDNPHWELITFTLDSTFTKLEIIDNILIITDSHGKALKSDTINPMAHLLFTSIDPKANEMPWVSPYVYCLGNPIRFCDTDGQRPTEYEAALMADFAYNPSEKLPNGLNEWHISTLETSIKMNNMTGLKSVLLEKTTDGKTEYAYVFTGSNTLIDYIEDLNQIVGLSIQYKYAISSAKTLSDELGSNELTFVGHSLGGGEAAAASMATGRAAITFNPAAVSPLTKLFNNLGNTSNITNYRIVPLDSHIGGCFVNNIQDNLGMSAPGNTINIPIDSHNSFTAHQIYNFINYFKP